MLDSLKIDKSQSKILKKRNHDPHDIQANLTHCYRWVCQFQFSSDITKSKMASVLADALHDTETKRHLNMWKKS